MLAPRWAFFYGIVCGLIVGLVFGAMVIGHGY
jgi:hypothetical protein